MSELQVASGVSSGSLARAAGAAAAVPGFPATSDGLGQSLLFFLRFGKIVSKWQLKTYFDIFWLTPKYLKYLKDS